MTTYQHRHVTVSTTLPSDEVMRVEKAARRERRTIAGFIREAVRDRIAATERAKEWEAVARNLAQCLSNTVEYAKSRSLTAAEVDELRDTFKHQCEAHGVSP